ncbi:MAG: hypothetical protein KDA57_19870 [Planctomycetales bacterium]|nr:hypothetical protein [Planctomycetales bacterium]
MRGCTVANLDIGDMGLGNGFQERVTHWLADCFGPDIALDKLERVHRFLEEALELAQASGCTHEDAAALADYVFSRPIGDVAQETGGVLVTLAGLAQAHAVNMNLAGDSELARNQSRVGEIRAKRANKREDSPLPQ